MARAAAAGQAELDVEDAADGVEQVDDARPAARLGRHDGFHDPVAEPRRGRRLEPPSATLRVTAKESRLKTRCCLLALALPACAFTTQAAEVARPAAVGGSQAPRAGIACPAASGLPARGAATSKLRHVPDESDPCADSRGVGRPAHAPASSPAS